MDRIFIFAGVYLAGLILAIVCYLAPWVHQSNSPAETIVAIGMFSIAAIPVFFFKNAWR